MSEFRAVLFDMDGVLVDTEAHWHELWESAVFNEAVDGEPTRDDVRGRSYPESIADLESQYGLERDRAYYEELLEERAIDLYASEADADPAVHELFDLVRERGLPVGIVSSARRDWIQAVVDRFDLEPLDIVLSAFDAPGAGKPAPDVYEHAASELGVDPASCIVIEDSTNGVRAAAGAGATVIRFALGEDVDAMAGANYVANDAAELERILQDLLDGE
ncbi:HAD family hydrolase [Salinarchaeum chitinilyticum]